MWDMKVVLLLLSMEVMDVACNTLCKAAMAKGMSSFIFTAYTHGISCFFFIPLSFLVHSCCTATFLYIGIRYSSPTLASAMNNLSPAVTFIMAILFRMEILNFRARSSLLKILGTLVSISGAFIVTFYQGLPIILFPSSPTKSYLQLLLESEPNWVLGGFFLATSSTFLSLSYIIKTWIARDFNSEVLITLISFFFETTVAALVTLAAEKGTSVWFPSLGIEVIAISFGAVGLGMINCFQTWACGKKGPLFVAMFKPLQMIIAVILGVSFLKDILHLGSVIGGLVIALGFYTVMKGKAALLHI